MNTEIVSAIITGVFSLLAAKITWKSKNRLIWIVVVVFAVVAGAISYRATLTVGGHYATNERGQEEAGVYMDGFATAKVWYSGTSVEDTYVRSWFSPRWHRDGDKAQGFFEKAEEGQKLKFTTMKGPVVVWNRISRKVEKVLAP